MEPQGPAPIHAIPASLPPPAKFVDPHSGANSGNGTVACPYVFTLKKVCDAPLLIAWRSSSIRLPASSLLPTAFCLLPSADCLLPTAFCLRRRQRLGGVPGLHRRAVRF